MKEILAELTPYNNKEKLLKYAKELIDYSDFIDIPDSPLGIPSPSSSILSCMIKEKFPEANIITNIRLYDINRLSLINSITALKMNKINHFLLVRGDMPKIGNKVDEIIPDDAIGFIRSMNIDGYFGLLLNLNKTIDEIELRIKKRASFYLITRPWFSEKIKQVSKMVREQKSKLYIYFVMLTDKNKEFLLNYLPKEELIHIDNLKESIQVVNDYVDGILFSSPMDHKGLVNSLRLFQKYF
ncbi:5,10-methylenetetrahydrofolate reductase [Caldisphaera lagunensis DSM 15908]|uniref:5,10-methylenetetrahydrofolate reductase n=1 Tax=Caldisphaera lagunensis (strain DSM 15908 / JCM 11604 / ANMR 0165 / IC-154) TaxID=1056495 RepID=L0AA39_CALLD|nr:5,10-methylenetetrahydrofolate reductase [Caldisphaera lagunensis]AFZ69992.1 5,10-methylenetetrahydrofolate reductase [Caldisphaera lagunensis DSM 15908]